MHGVSQGKERFSVKSRKKKVKSKNGRLTALRVIGYVVISFLLIVALFAGVGCMILSRVVEGAIILTAWLVLLFLVIELVRMDKKANASKKSEDLGAVLMEIKAVSMKWADGARDFGTISFREKGIDIDADAGVSAYPWVMLESFSVGPDSNRILTMTCDGRSVRVTCNNELKCMVARKVLSEHVQEVEATA